VLTLRSEEWTSVSPWEGDEEEEEEEGKTDGDERNLSAAARAVLAGGPADLGSRLRQRALKAGCCNLQLQTYRPPF
jgi:hypothetical protein